MNPTKRSIQFRWFILVLLFLATTILYIDRAALGMLACGICAIPVIFVPHTGSLWLALVLISLAAGCGYLIALLLIHLIMPKIEPLKL